MEAKDLSVEEINKAEKLLQEITEKTIALQDQSFATIQQITKELRKEQIYVLNESNLDKAHAAFVYDYFNEKVSASLITVMMDAHTKVPTGKGNNVFLSVRMQQKQSPNPLFALIQIPSHLDRIIVLPPRGEKRYIILLDDLIRHQMHRLFEIFQPTNIEAHMIKFTRDAELDFDDDLNKKLRRKNSFECSRSWRR